MTKPPLFLPARKLDCEELGCVGVIIDSVCIEKWEKTLKHMGVSENSVPLNPMVNDHYPY